MASDDTVSNPAPDVVKRLKAIRARDGEVVVIDPRRTETAAMASAHHFVKPGTDVGAVALLRAFSRNDWSGLCARRLHRQA
jgi:anaerobic selenocysteine-containing dehydrogenase